MLTISNSSGSILRTSFPSWLQRCHPISLADDTTLRRKGDGSKWRGAAMRVQTFTAERSFEVGTRGQYQVPQADIPYGGEASIQAAYYFKVLTRGHVGY